MNDDDVISRAELDELLNESPVAFLEALLEALERTVEELEELDGDEQDTLQSARVRKIKSRGGVYEPRTIAAGA